MKALLEKGAEITLEDDNDKTVFEHAKEKNNKGALKAIAEAATKHYASTSESSGHNVLEGETLKVAKQALSKMGGKTRRRKHKRKQHRKTHHRRR